MLLSHLLVCGSQALIATAGTLQAIDRFLWFDQTSMSTATEPKKVPGHNNATFCPDVEQLFSVEFLEIAPDPIPVNRIFFVYLNGFISADSASAIDLLKAQLRITAEAALDSGESQGQTYEIPLKTTSFGQAAHLTIRNATSVNTHLTPGDNDILIDYWIPGMFLQTGLWRFRVEGVLEDGRHLFCMSLKQRLEHSNR